MFGRILRRFSLPIGIGVLVGASAMGTYLYAITATSGLASSTHSSHAGMVRTVSFLIGSAGKTGGAVKAIHVNSGHVNGGRVESAAVPQSNGNLPALYAGPGTVCMDYSHYDAGTVTPGGTAWVNIPLTSGAFAIGSMFEETTVAAYADETLSYDPSTNAAKVSVANVGSIDETISGYFGVLYYPVNGSC